MQGLWIRETIFGVQCGWNTWWSTISYLVVWWKKSCSSRLGNAGFVIHLDYVHCDLAVMSGGDCDMRSWCVCYRMLVSLVGMRMYQQLISMQTRSLLHNCKIVSILTLLDELDWIRWAVAEAYQVICVACPRASLPWILFTCLCSCCRMGWSVGHICVL